jgi:diguanylate cyclase (GGDEF)-like protein
MTGFHRCEKLLSLRNRYLSGSSILTATARSRPSLYHAPWLAIGLLASLAGMPSAATPIADRWSSLTTTVFRNYGRDQGLPHPVPTALVQDRAGFIWIGTQGGLARWDGYRFHSYKADAAVAGSLPDDWVQTLHVDRAGRLWIGGGAGGLARYDDIADRFVAVPLGTRSARRSHIGAIADDGAGGLWIGKDDGLHHLDPATGATRPPLPGGPDGGVQAILRDRTGALWVGTGTGLTRRAPGATAFAAVSLDGRAAGVTTLFADDKGRIWIGTRRHGVFVADRADATPRPVGAGSPLASGSIAAIAAAGPDSVWVGLRGGGIVAVDGATGRLQPIRQDRAVPNSLIHDDVWTLLRDRSGAIWAGSTGGLSYHPHDAGLISTVYGATMQPGGPSAADIMSILPARDGRIWVGYLDGGADRIDPATGRVEALRPDPADPDHALPPDAMFAFAEADDGTIYFGTRRGLYAKPPNARTPHIVVLPGRRPDASVGALAFDAGVLWIGGEDDGLRAIVPGSRDTPRFGPVDSAKLPDPGVNVIRRGRGADLWVGTRDGLARIDLATRAIEIVAATPTDRTALPGRFVVALLIDRRGRLWVGTFGGGIAVMTGRAEDGRPIFRRIGLAEGLPHLNVDSLQLDGDGTIWAGTDDGLARIDPATLAVRAVRPADGAPLIDYFGGAGATLPTGEALFGAKGGFSIVRPGPLPLWRLQPPVMVTDLRVGGVALPAGRLNRGGAIAPVTVSPGANSLIVEFAALDFSAPERNLYAYRLDGFDKHWIETDASRRLASYTNLPPGDYTLLLRGSNRDGAWSVRELALPIRVLPASYQRLWFKAAIGIALLLGVRAVIRWRTRWLRRRQRELEAQIADRTADLIGANERLAHLAMTDPLTGCANRRHFIERAQDVIALAGRRRMPLSLAILDLDDFKQVNDRFGHPAGDAVLAMVGSVIDEHMRPTDLAGRIGGEEFALLMPDTHAAGARLLADRLRVAIGEAMVQIDDAEIRVTSSLGVAGMRSGENFGQLYARADTALYRAKQSGRNRVVSASDARPVDPRPVEPVDQQSGL